MSPLLSTMLRASSSRFPLLDTADWYVDARRYEGTGALLDQSPNKLHAKLGSSGVAQIVPASGGGNALSLPGVAGNYASVPDEAALDITGDIDIRCKIAAVDWTRTLDFELVTKRGAGAVAMEFSFRMAGASNSPELYWHSGSGYVQPGAATVAPTVADGDDLWLRATRTISGTDYEVDYYTSSDGETWTQLGATVTIATTGNAPGASTNAVGIGSRPSDSRSLEGKVYRAQVYDGIAGTAVLDVDFTSQPVSATSFTATTGQTVTVNSSGADTNDPLWLPWTGTDYVYLPGVSGNAPSTPDSASFVVDADLEVIFHGEVDTPGSLAALVGHYDFAINQRAWRVELTSGRIVQLRHSTDGTAISLASASSASSKDWLKVTYAHSGGLVSFFDSDDGETWSSLGTAAGAGGTLHDSTAALVVGGSPSSGTLSDSLMSGKVYSASVSIDGTVVASFDASDITSPYQTVTGGASETWTLNRSSSGRKLAVVDRPLFLFGTDDYMEVADNDALDFADGQDFTLVAAYRTPTFTAANQTIITNRTSAATTASVGWMIYQSSTGSLLHRNSDGTDAVLAGVAGPTAGSIVVAAGRVTDSTIDITVPTGTASASATALGSVANSEVLRIGTLSGTPGSYADMEFLGAAIFRRALTDAEVTTVVAEFTT